MFPQPPDSPTGPHDTDPAHPDTFPGSLDTFPGYIGSISFDGNNDDLAILVVHKLKHCGQFIYLLVECSHDLQTVLQDILTHFLDPLTRFLDLIYSC